MPRSTSVTVTLAPVTTAPLGSRTRPTMAPASFCVHSGVASARSTDARNTEKNRAERVCGRRKRMGMASLLDAKPECSQAAWLGQTKIRVLATSSFRCNITNYYFYFRLIAFVNSDILAELPGNAVAQAGGVADGGTSGRTPRREVLYDRPQTRDCPYRNDARHDARSHAHDGLLEVAENAAEFAAEDGNRQARTHPAFRDQRGREGRRPGGADNERGRVSGDARWLCAGIFVEGWAEAFAGRAQRRRSRGQRFCAGGGQGCAFHARLRAGAGARSDREDGNREAGGDPGASAGAIGDGLAARAGARSL